MSTYRQLLVIIIFVLQPIVTKLHRKLDLYDKVHVVLLSQVL